MTFDPTRVSRAPRGIFAQLVRAPFAVGPALVFALIALLCAAAPLLTPYPPDAASLSDVLAPPGGAHLLGADASGRDILSRLLHGGRATMSGAVVAAAVALAVGVPAGLAAGFFQGRTGRVLDSLSNTLIIVPTQLVLIALIAVIGPDMNVVMAVLGVLTVPTIYRILRGTVAAVRGELYIDAARVSGLRDREIIVSHVLPVVRGPLVLQTAVVVGGAILIQTGLEFLGLGDPSSPSWGSLLQDGFAQLYRAPILVVWPSIALAITLGSVAFFASALRDVLAHQEKLVRKPRRRAAADVAPLDAGGPAEHLLDVRRLTVSYLLPDRRVLDVVADVSLTVDRGEILGLVGESGSGKTQTALAVLGLLDPGGYVSAGAILFDGQRLADSGVRSGGLLGRRIGYVPQEPHANLDPSFTIGSQLTGPLRQVLGLSRTEARDRALSLLRDVEIRDPESVMGAFPHQISGGMAQRVLIAGALSSGPDLIIADEPTTALDVTVQAGILRLLRRLRDERGVSLLIVTHNFGVVSDLCDRVAVMREGRIVETQTVEGLFDSPASPYARALLSAGLDGRPPRVDRTGGPPRE